MGDVTCSQHHVQLEFAQLRDGYALNMDMTSEPQQSKARVGLTTDLDRRPIERVRSVCHAPGWLTWQVRGIGWFIAIGNLII